MTALKLFIVAVALALAAVMQMTAAFSVGIGPARPDFLLTTLCCAAVLINYESSAAAGVWAGILMASVVGVNYGSFLVSRALTGALCGWLNQRFLRDDFFVPPLVTFVATFVCEGVYFLMAPTRHPIRWAEGVAWEALYNTALSIPITLLLRVVGVKRSQLSPFEQTGN